MPNFAGALKGEITRLARKEVRASVGPLKKLVAALRRRVAQQRRLIADLERGVRRGMKGARAATAATAGGEEKSQIRFSPAWVKRHRKKLKMSRRVYAKLIGVSAQTIFGWEAGRTRPRRGALEEWRRIRGMGVREVKALSGAETKRGRPATKRRGRPKAKRARLRSGMRRAAKKK